MACGRALLKHPWLLILFAAQLAAQAAPDFQRDVRPILAGHCFKCHGPDKKTRKAELRLDIRPEESLFNRLTKRIDHDDPDEVMPPPSSKKPLSSEQKRVLKEWVMQGAGYAEHWAFIPPKAAPLPRVNQTSWPRSDLDYFTLAQMESEGRKPAPEAFLARLQRSKKSREEGSEADGRRIS